MTANLSVFIKKNYIWITWFLFLVSEMGFNSRTLIPCLSACAVPDIFLSRKIPTIAESLSAKLNAVSENITFLRLVRVQNEVTVIHMFSWPEIRDLGTFYEGRWFDAQSLPSCCFLKDKKLYPT